MSFDYLLRGMIGCLFAASASMAMGQASFQGLGDLPGGNPGWPEFHSDQPRVSGDGSTVVGWSRSEYGVTPFRWTAAEGMVRIGDPPPSPWYNPASGVNYDGSVIVGEYDGEAFRWTPEGGMQMLGTVDVGTGVSTSAYDVSADGAVVTGLVMSYEVSVPFRWTPTGGMTLLEPPPGMRSRANGISGDGATIIGLIADRNGSQAARWTAQEGWVGLGWLPGGTRSEAYDVNGDGTVIVGSATAIVNGRGGSKPFRWTAAEGMVMLNYLPADSGLMFEGGTAVGVNADGSIIVGSSTTDRIWTGTGFQYVTDAWMWDDVHGTRKLADVLTELGVDLTRWHLSAATSISDDGRVIVGIGTNPAGFTEAWIAVIPEPASLSLLAFGGLTMLRRRRACGQ
jgi:uncharacterized membrane protein